jgi:hypothetical protein
MPKKKIKRVTQVRTHPMRVPVSKKNPTGITLRRQHPRRVYEALSANEIKSIIKNYKTKNITFPTAERLKKYKNSDTFDQIIAIWCDYFNQKFPPVPPDAPLDPDVVKALLASESSFLTDPPGNSKATGIAQITAETLRVLQDPDGEAKEHLFKEISKRDLKDPAIAIALATRWLFRKRETARSKLKRWPSTEELILEYKGLLESKTPYKQRALTKFREDYGTLKKN